MYIRINFGLFTYWTKIIDDVKQTEQKQCFFKNPKTLLKTMAENNVSYCTFSTQST